MIGIINNIIGRAVTGALEGAAGSIWPGRQQKKQKGDKKMKAVIGAVIRWALAILGGGVLGNVISQEEVNQLQSAVETIIGALAVAIPIIWSIVDKVRAKK